MFTPLVVGILLIVGFWPAVVYGSRLRPVQRIVLLSLSYFGDVPKHVAIIMDGNRRWAKERKLVPQEGHRRGVKTFVRTLEWCLDAGIRTLTVYAFSIENFKRPKDEVDTIMALAVKNCESMLEAESVIHRNKVRVRFWGQLSMVSKELQGLCAELMCMTRDYDGPVFNICLAYTARVEIADALVHVAGAALSGDIATEDINENLFSQFLESGITRGGQQMDDYPDVIIRTSGETRLSDFLLWQAAFAYLAFIPVMWPDFSPIDYAKIALAYRRAKPHLAERRRQYESFMQRQGFSNECNSTHFLKELQERHNSHLAKLYLEDLSC